jgi:enoyl-CoA hydratase
VIVVEPRDRVTLIRLNRPERRNALSSALVEGLIDAVSSAAAAGAGAVVITGNGAAFCAGGDLAEGLAGGDGFLGGHRQRGRYAELLAMLAEVRVPVVAAVNGDALGGGLGLCAACDLAIVDPAARLGTPEVKVGLFPMIILAVLQRHVPRKALMELVLTGDRVSAERAVQLGLANRVSAPGASVDEALALAAAIASRSSAVVGLGKSAFYEASDLPYRAALRHLHDQLTLNLLTEDAAEGVAAFLQKREPQWKNR